MSARRPPPEFELDCGCRFVLEETRERITSLCPPHSREFSVAHDASSGERAAARQALYDTEAA